MFQTRDQEYIDFMNSDPRNALVDGNQAQKDAMIDKLKKARGGHPIKERIWKKKISEAEKFRHQLYK